MKNGRFRQILWPLGFLTALIFCAALLFTQAQQPSTSPFTEPENDGCTSIMVGRLASTDGSVMTAHTCDGGSFRNWLRVEPARKNIPEGTMHKIYDGLMGTEFPGDMRRVREKGEIPEATETYAWVNASYPFMNDKGLAIGETTISGRRELGNDEGMFMIEELEHIALERCATARDAIKLMGELATKYGYGDGAECLTVADSKEVWQFEIMGGGAEQIGAVWAAVRIPDENVGISANITRISEIDLSKPDYYMASANVFSLAEKMGWYDSKKGEKFKFWKAYTTRRKAYDIREFYVLSTLAPSLNLTMDMEELPFSVKPEKKLSIKDVMKYYRETYEGTDYDLTKNMATVSPSGGGRGGFGGAQPPQTSTGQMVKPAFVSPWAIGKGGLSSYINSLKPGTISSTRFIAIDGCAYSHIIQCRDGYPDGLKAVAWFSFDNPALSPRIPIFSGTLSLPKSFEFSGQLQYREDSATWWFRRTNRLATNTLNWGQFRLLIEGSVKEFEDKALLELPQIEKIALDLYNQEKNAGKEPTEYKKYLTQYTNDFARAAMNKWWEIGNQIFWRLK
jgi:dipeptidase